MSYLNIIRYNYILNFTSDKNVFNLILFNYQEEYIMAKRGNYDTHYENEYDYDLVKIIRPGNENLYGIKFECNYCECIFKVSSEHCNPVVINGDQRYTYKCPTCHSNVISTRNI